MPRHKPTADETRSRLWNDPINSTASAGAGERYQATILEQYKLYVEMADRISSRRGLTNTFFLTLNTLIFTLVGAFLKGRTPEVSARALAVLLAVVLGECGVWWLIVRSYRQLNSAKYLVVGLLEERLPASPFSSAEWTALEKGENWRIYLPLTHVEQWVPLLFATCYVIGFVLVVTA